MMTLSRTGYYCGIRCWRQLHTDFGKSRLAEIQVQRSHESFAGGARSVSGSVANFGTWSVDEAAKTLTYHIRGSTYPNQDGTNMESTVRLTGDEWTGTIARTTSGRQSVMVWEWAK
jgi:hypothetical protein